MLERRLVEGTEIEELTPAWRALAERAARSPFESPDWLVPWQRHYGSEWQSRILTWWDGGELAAVAPLAWRRRAARFISYRELAFWGWTETPLRGWADIVAEPGLVDTVAADFAAWLAHAGLAHADEAWDVFQYLHVPADSPTLAAIAARSGAWWRVDLSFALHSLEYVVPLPSGITGWPGPLGPKARHEIRREARLFERRRGGRIEQIGDPASTDEIVEALAVLASAHWGEREAYFRRDPRFKAFLSDAARQAFASRLGWALVGRDEQGIAACLVMLALGGTAVATLLGVSQHPEYRTMSLGKVLFDRALHDAFERGCQTFSFLTEDGYKTRYWHAQGRPTNSGFLGRGPIGRTIAAYTTARRVLPRRVRDLAAGRQDPDYRP